MVAQKSLGGRVRTDGSEPPRGAARRGSRGCAAFGSNFDPTLMGGERNSKAVRKNPNQGRSRGFINPTGPASPKFSPLSPPVAIPMGENFEGGENVHLGSLGVIETEDGLWTTSSPQPDDSGSEPGTPADGNGGGYSTPGLPRKSKFQPKGNQLGWPLEMINNPSPGAHDPTRVAGQMVCPPTAFFLAHGM